MFRLQGSQRGLHAFVVLTVSALCFFAFKYHPEFPSTTGNGRTTSLINGSTIELVKRVAIPFGHKQAHNFSNPLTSHSPVRVQKRALSFFDAICKGEKHFLNIARAFFSEPGSARTYSVQEIEEAGWTIDGDFLLNIPDATRPALKEFNIKDDADSNKIRYATQDKSYTSVGGTQEVRQSEHDVHLTPAHWYIGIYLWAVLSIVQSFGKCNHMPR